jgi:tetratricopeptide (TPR) repeat protein
MLPEQGMPAMNKTMLILNELRRDLEALALSRQGRDEEALAVLEAGDASGLTADRLLLLGQLAARCGRWSEAIDYWKKIGAITPAPDFIRQRASHHLLEAMIMYGRRDEWGKAIEALDAGADIWPQNPVLELMPEDVSAERPVLLFLSGYFEDAVGLWQQELNRKGFSPELLHNLGIACNCLLDASEKRPLAERVALLAKTQAYWSALSRETGYWTRFYTHRQRVYGDKVGLEDFLAVSSTIGPARCETILNQWQTEAENNEDRDGLDLLSRCRLDMAVERCSAELLAELKSGTGTDWPGGGFGLTSIFWGENRLDKELTELPDGPVGSTAWMVKRLRRPDLKRPIVQFLAGDYMSVLGVAQESKDQDLLNLMGLAAQHRTENVPAGQNMVGCRLIASIYPRIPDRQRSKQVMVNLQEMSERRYKGYLARNEHEQGIDFLEDVLAKAREAGAEARDLPKLRELWAEAVMRQAEKTYHAAKDMSIVSDAYQKALVRADNKQAIDDQYKAIVRYHAVQMANTGDFDGAEAFMSDLQKKHKNKKFITAITGYIRASKMLSRGLNIGDPSVQSMLAEAYENDSRDQEYRKLYSLSLSNGAVNTLNAAVNQPRPMRESIVLAANVALSKIEQAMTIDPGNDHARQSLTSLMDLKQQLGIF